MPSQPPAHVRPAEAEKTDRATLRNVTAITITLVLLSVLSGSAVFISWKRFTHFSRVETRRNNAGMELEINAFGSSLALLQYFVDHDQDHFLIIEDDREDFERALDGYRLAGSEQVATDEYFLGRAAGTFDRLLQSGNALVADDLRVRRITADLLLDLADLRSLEAPSAGGPSGAPANQSSAQEVAAAVAAFIASRDPSAITALGEQYDRANRSRLGRESPRTSRLLDQAVSLANRHQELLAHAASFDEARTALDTILDDGLQASTTASLTRAATETWIWSLVGVISSLILLLLTCVLGVWMRSMTMRLMYSKQALSQSRDRAKRALAETAELKAESERLALVAQHTDNGVVMTDVEGRVEWVNDGFTRITGYTIEEMRGRTPGSVLQGEETSESTRAYMRRQIRSKQGFKVEVYNYAKNGRGYWVAIEAMPIRNDDGEVTGFFSIERDLTAKKAAEEIAADARRRSQALLEAIDRVQCRMEVSPEGEILDANSNLAAALGYEPEELIGLQHNDLVPPDVRESTAYQEFRLGLERGKVQQGVYRRLAKDGSERWFFATCCPVLDRQGHVDRIALYGIDQTEQHRLEDQLSRAQKLESIGQLAAGVAHEINTPMQFVGDNIEYLSECSDKLFRVVDSYQSMLDDDEMPSSWRKRRQELEHLTSSVRFDRIRKQVPAAIEESRDGVRRTIEIVRAMKEFSHPGAKEKAGANLNTLVESTVAISRNRWKYAAEIDLQLDPDLPDAPMLASEINQVLLNLIVNAGDAIAEKNEGQEGALGTITVRTHADDDWVSVEVEDDGCGIPKEIQRKVFDPFFTTKDVGKGTGQGLSITHSVVVNQHGGQLSLSSEPGKGAKFSIQLPRHVESEDQDLPGSTIADPAFA